MSASASEVRPTSLAPSRATCQPWPKSQTDRGRKHQLEDFLIGAVAFAFIFGSALLGMFAARRLPTHHLTPDIRTAVSAAAAVVGTLSALVLGLMITTASGTYSSAAHEVTEISVDLIRMDRMLRRYGPPADQARVELRAYTSAKTGELFPGAGESPATDASTLATLESLQDALITLSPATPLQTWLRTEALKLSDDVGHARWMLAQQIAGGVAPAFLVLLIFWLGIVFAGVGLFSPVNATAITSLGLCALAVAAGIAMILELQTPFRGLVQVSPTPMLRALAEIRR